MTVHLPGLLLSLSTSWRSSQVSQQHHLMCFSSELVRSPCDPFLFSELISGGFMTCAENGKFGSWACMATNTLSFQAVAALPPENPWLLCLVLLPGQQDSSSHPCHSLLLTGSELAPVSWHHSRQLEGKQKPEMISLSKVLLGQCSYTLSLRELVFDVV